MNGDQTFALLVGLFCVSVIVLAVLIVAQSVALVAANRMLRRDSGELGIPNRVFDVSKAISDPFTLAVYGCVGLAVIGFPERFDELIRSHLWLAFAFGIFGVGSGVIQFILARRLKRTVSDYAQKKGIKL